MPERDESAAVPDDELTLAIVRRPGYGMRDMHVPGLWFDTYTSDCTAALQVFTQPEADEVIKAFGVRDVHDLEGLPCWVSGNQAGGFIRYVKPATMGAKR
jgi:hypothetical protein